MQRGILAGWVALSLAAVMSLAWPCAAQTTQQRNEARKLGGEALDLFKAGDFKAALAKFEEADKIVPAPTLKVRIARCLDKLDRMKSSAEKYREVIAIELKPTSPKVYAEAREDAVNDLAKLLAQVPKLTVIVAGPGSEIAEVTLDGKPLARSAIGEEQSMDPGFYQLEAKSGAKSVRKSVRLDRGKIEKAELRFASELPPGDKPADYLPAFRIVGWTMVGIGGAGIIAGAVSGGLVLSQKKSFNDEYPDGSCNAGLQDCGDAIKFNRERAISTGTFIAGFAAGAVGAGFLVYAAVASKPAAEKPVAALMPCPHDGGAGICGTF